MIYNRYGDKIILNGIPWMVGMPIQATMTGNLTVSGYLYPSVYLKSTYNNNSNRTVFEGSYVGASSFASWEDSSGNNRRMLEVRTKAYQNDLDRAVLLRTCDNGSWGAHRLFHSGMETPVPIANGGTGATTAAGIRSTIGADNASNLSSGTIPAGRLPFKVAYGSTSINGNGATTIYYSSAGFTSTPTVSKFAVQAKIRTNIRPDFF